MRLGSLSLTGFNNYSSVIFPRKGGRAPDETGTDRPRQQNRYRSVGVFLAIPRQPRRSCRHTSLD
jgi:hypothetical protein